MSKNQKKFFLSKGIKRLKICTLAVMLVFTGLLQAQNQTYPISLNLRNSTLKEFFRQIESKTSFTVVYRDVLLDNNKDVSISVSNRPLNEVVRAVLTPKGLQANFRSGTIVVTKATPTKLTNANTPQTISNKKVISGTVVDAKTGEPIVGASVVEKGTTNGVITDHNGIYSLRIPFDAVLSISYMGYSDQEINTSGKTSLNISLEEDSKSLDEIVVIGYQDVKKKDLTGSVSSADVNEMIKAPVPNIDQALAGRVAGLWSLRAKECLDSQ